MKITVFNGSPRGAGGNTHSIVKEFARGAEEAGAEVENIFLVTKTIKHCRGCFSCWTLTPGKCVIEDDMTDLLQRVGGSDAIVFATPLYVDNVSGLMKNFMDRLIPLADPHFTKDENGECRHLGRENVNLPRKIVVISNSGFPEQNHFQVLRLLFRRIARNFSAELVGEIYRGAGEILGTKNVFLRAHLIGYRKLVRAAGREIVEQGRISEETMKQLERPLVSDSQYIRGANKHWDRELEKSRK